MAYDNLHDKHKVLIAAHMDLNEPTSYYEAATDSNWVAAIEKELTALNKNHMWDFVLLPKEKKAIGYKWIYIIKKNGDGSIERYKAMLVAKGFTQKYGIDC